MTGREASLRTPKSAERFKTRITQVSQCKHIAHPCIHIARNVIRDTDTLTRTTKTTPKAIIEPLVYQPNIFIGHDEAEDSLSLTKIKSLPEVAAN